MAPLSNEHIEFRLKTARSLANPTNVRDPVLWLSMVDELERSLKQNEPEIPPLIERFCSYARAEMEGLASLVLLSENKGDPLDRPLLPLYAELKAAVYLTLVFVGLHASAALRTAYEAMSRDAPERVWLLELMADIGDPEHAILFEQLDREEVEESMKSIRAMGIVALQPMVSNNISNYVSNYEDDIQLEITGLRARYNCARQRRESKSE
jgi:hypothetical protein